MKVISIYILTHGWEENDAWIKICVMDITYNYEKRKYEGSMLLIKSLCGHI